jgi:hypothetical protein
VKNQAADATSRVITSADHPPEPIDEIPVLVVMVTEEEENDIETTPDDDAPHPVIPDLGPRVRALDEGLTPISFDRIHEEQQDCPFVFQLWARMEMPQIRHLGLKEEDGLLHIRNIQGEDIALISLRDRILTLTHFPRIASHPGGRRMYRIVAQHWWWPALAIRQALCILSSVSGEKNCDSNGASMSLSALWSNGVYVDGSSRALAKDSSGQSTYLSHNRQVFEVGSCLGLIIYTCNHSR